MIIFSVILMLIESAQATCNGRMTNPVTDVCWSCLFPISVGGFTVAEGAESYDTPNPASPVCTCGSPIPRVGISVGFWEPVRMADVVREPYCFVNLGGISIDPGYPAPAGAQSYEDSTNRKAFYQVHWYEYPALIWLDIITFVTCLEGTDFDIAHMSEFDVTWNNDLDSFIFFPETALFGNPVAQAACATDCVAASTGKLPMDALFWCAGCHGSMYPMTGNIGNQTSPLQGSVLLVERSTFNLHRIGAIRGSMGTDAMCGTYYMPIMDKSQYKTQLTYPFTGKNHGSELACNPYGRTTTLWESGKSFPEKGEDFGYLIWRKRNCCAF
jgi:conjugal transfer pilus assembly protein TraU